MGDCIDSVRGLTDDIVVVDAGSHDQTRAICRAKGARVFERRWTGFSDQKNFGNSQARHEWILSLDADERVTPELAASIRREFAHGPPNRDAYSIRFRNYYGGQPVRFGAWNPEWHIRLFDRRQCDWNTDEVHEGLRGLEDCTSGRLHGCIRHLPVSSREELAAKTRRYSELFAEKLRRKGRIPGWSKVWLNPVWRFSRDFFLRLGILDGGAGWAIAWEAAHYTHLKYWRALPARPLRRPIEWLAPGAAAATFAALFYVMPVSAFLGFMPGAAPSDRNELQITGPNQTAESMALHQADDDDPLSILPDDDDVLT